MTYTVHTLENVRRDHRPFLAALLSGILQRLGDGWNLVYRVYRPEEDAVDLKDIGKRTVLVLWGDERSRVFPKEYFSAAGAVVKCYCPEEWEKHGIIPVTDIAMCWDGDGLNEDIRPCSQRPCNVFFSGNFNYRRIDLFRACAGRSFGWPFRLSACYPITGSQPFFHKIMAIAIKRIAERCCHSRNFSQTFPNSFIQFTGGFATGLSHEEYKVKIHSSKIVLCAPGFMTNETCRLIEAACAGCVCLVGRLPDNDMYRGNPFVRIDDWRKVRPIINNLISDNERLDAMGTACRNWYLSRFSPFAQAERIATAIQMNNH